MTRDRYPHVAGKVCHIYLAASLQIKFSQLCFRKGNRQLDGEHSMLLIRHHGIYCRIAGIG